MSKTEAAARAVRDAFLTSTSGDGKYYLTLRYPTMEAMHAAHDALLALRQHGETK